MTVIVHGCFSSAGQFRSLANVFAFHGQQTVCFNYNDRDSLTESSAQLISAIEMLSEVLRQPEITVIGHSQGGLVARRAFIEERADRLDSANANFRLTTISAPFGGIQSAAHCGSKALAWLSLGLTKPVCRMITGSKYREIPPNSEFIKRPGLMLPAVRTHLRIVTDELDSCRQYDEHNNCIEDDFVFSLDEQSQPAIQSDTELRSIVVKSGHVEIVGGGQTAPTKLIEILQRQGIMASTPPELEDQLAQLLTHLYLTPAVRDRVDERVW